MLVPVGNAGAYTGTGNNTWLLASPDAGACLVDAGIGNQHHLDALTAALAAQQSALAHVLVTHAHLDHASGAPMMAARFPGASFAKYAWPAHDVAGVEWQHIEDGAQVDVCGVSLTALHTPGHAPDHLCFWHEPSRTVFSGDLVHATSSVAIIHSRGGDLGQYLASLERLIALGPACLLPGHGPVMDHPGQAVRALQATRDHRLRREEQVSAAVAAGHETVQAITDSIYDGLAPELVRLACENVRAHLEKLTRDGRAVRDDAAARSTGEAGTADDGVRWRPV